MFKVIYLSLGGILGTLARYYLSNASYRILGTEFPYGTFFVNMLGCFLIGLFGAFAEKKLFFGPELRLLLMIGFCGAFTTFSSYIFETNGLLQNGELLKAAANIFLNILAGFFLFELGMMIGKAI
jgi:fluoride exporter